MKEYLQQICLLVTTLNVACGYPLPFVTGFSATATARLTANYERREILPTPASGYLKIVVPTDSSLLVDMRQGSKLLVQMSKKRSIRERRSLPLTNPSPNAIVNSPTASGNKRSSHEEFVLDAGANNEEAAPEDEDEEDDEEDVAPTDATSLVQDSDTDIAEALPEHSSKTDVSETTKPAADTTQASTDAAQPVAEETQPLAQATQPANEPAQAAVDTAQPAAEAPQPVAEKAHSVAEASHPANGTVANEEVAPASDAELAANGDVAEADANGEVDNSDVGNADAGNTGAANATVANDDIAEGDVANADDVAEGDVADGDVAEGDVAGEDVANGGVAEGDVANGDVANATVANDDVAGDDGNLVEGDEADSGSGMLAFENQPADEEEEYEEEAQPTGAPERKAHIHREPKPQGKKEVD